MTSSSAPAVHLRPATADDGDAIAALLRAAALPAEDFRAHLAGFLVAVAADGAVVGAIGCERHGADGLLRSAVLAPTWRNRGLGTRLLAALAERAAAGGIERFYLLTTTAERFFVRHGFGRIDRAAAPPSIAASAEFRSLCPASAVCLRRRVAAPPP